MPDFVGAKQIDALTAITKRDLLLFDKIATTDLEQAIRQAREPNVAADLEFLATHGLIVGIDRHWLTETFFHSTQKDLLLASESFVSRALFLIAQLLMRSETDHPKDLLWLLLVAHQNNLDYHSRLIALHYDRSQLGRCAPILNELPTVDMFKLRHNASRLRMVLENHRSQIEQAILGADSVNYDDWTFLHELVLETLEKLEREALEGEDANAHQDKNVVVDVVLRNLPIPDESIGWEELLDFRSQPETQAYLLSLRRWMRNMSKDDLSPVEVEEELQDLLAAYGEHLRFHKLKTKVGILETLVCVPAEMLENVAKIKWGAAAKALFSVRQRRVALLEAERTAPGREVAYIVKSKEHFQ